jgi:hypothetical protein
MHDTLFKENLKKRIERLDRGMQRYEAKQAANRRS